MLMDFRLKFFSSKEGVTRPLAPDPRKKPFNFILTDFWKSPPPNFDKPTLTSPNFHALHLIYTELPLPNLLTPPMMIFEQNYDNETFNTDTLNLWVLLFSLVLLH